MIIFNPLDWYWQIGSDSTRRWSSAANAYMSVSDPALVNWIERGNAISRLDTEAELVALLAVQAPMLVPAIPAGLIAYAASVRYTKEVAGTTISGIKVATDDRSKQMILGARVAAVADSNFTTPWVGSDGSIVVLTASQIIGVSDAVLSRVQLCFSTFADVVVGVGNNTILTKSDIDAAFAAITA